MSDQEDVQLPAKRKKQPADDDNDSDGSFHASEESDDSLPDIVSDEGEHGDDSDFDYEEYKRFKQAEAETERAATQPTQSSPAVKTKQPQAASEAPQQTTEAPQSAEADAAPAEEANPE